MDKSDFAMAGLLALVWAPAAAAGGYWLVTGKSLLTLIGW